MKPVRGEIVAFGIGTGEELSLVISNDICNKYSGVIIVATLVSVAETKDHADPLLVLVNSPEGGLRENMFVDCALILPMKQDEVINTLGRLASETMTKVNVALKLSLDIPDT